MKLLLLLTFIFGSSSLFSQPGNNAFYAEYLDIYRGDAGGLNISNESGTKILTDSEIKEIKGSPYLNDKFRLGSIFSEDSLVIANIPLRYNIYTDQIEAKNNKSDDDKSLFAIKKDDTDIIITIREKIFRYVPAYLMTNGMDGSYYQIIFKNEHYDLYKKFNVKYIPNFKANTSFDNDRPAEFSMTDAYYLVSKEDEFISLPEGKSRIIKTLAADKKVLRAYLKENDLDISKERDLARLIAYYNSLL